MPKDKEPMKRCPLCGTKLWIPSFKCEECNKYYQDSEVIKEGKGKARCPDCALRVKPISKEDLQRDVKCRECGFSFEDMNYWEETLTTSTEMTPKQEIEVLGSELQSLSDEVERILKEAQKEDDTYRCPKCGKEIEVDAKSCPECGVEFFELEEVPEIILEDETEDGEKRFECSECGTLVPFEATECPSCGILFTDEEEKLFECPACGFEVDPQTKQCPKCDIEFILGEESKEEIEEVSLGEKTKEELVGVSLGEGPKEDLVDVSFEEEPKEDMEEIFLGEEAKEDIQEIRRKEEKEPETELEELVETELEMERETGLTDMEPEKEKIKAIPTAGITNGLTNGLRTGKRGMTNGLTNGFRKADTGLTNGLTNGITNGLVNGLKALKMGMTNGLTNGNGITNGLGARRGVKEKKKGKLKILIIPIIIILLVISPYLLVGFTKESKGIVIDGNFGDWDGLLITSDAQEATAFNPNVNIIDYRVDSRLMELSFYLKVEGDILAGEPDGERYADTAYIFIDSDQSSDSGYYLKGIGADFMAEIYGWNGELIGQNLYRYTSSEQDWNLWMASGSIAAAVSGSEMETQLSYNTLILQENDAIDVLFYMQSWNKDEDYSDTVISNEKGVLQLTQQGVAKEVINGDGNRLLKLELSAFSADITVDELRAERRGIGSENDVGAVRLEEENGNTVAFGTLSENEVTFILDLRISKDQSTVLYIVVFVSDNAFPGNSIGFKIQDNHDIVTDVGTTTLKQISPEDEKYETSYLILVPQNIRIDGAFADWNDKELHNDTQGDVERKDLDILKYGVSNTNTQAAFYLNVDDEIHAGVKVPYWNNRKKSEPMVGGEVTPAGVSPPILPKTGEDIVYIFIDTISGVGYNYGLPIHADHMIEVRGRHNEVIDSACYEWTGSYSHHWDWTESASVDVALDIVSMEVAVGWDDIGVPANNGSFDVYFLTTDWERRESDLSNGEGAIEGTRGTRSEILPELVSGHSTDKGDRFGWNVSFAGDLNNDGYDDVVVGAPYFNTSTGGGDWWNDAWSNRMRLTFDNSEQTENLLNFPVMVNLSSSNFDYTDVKGDGSDLRFIDDDSGTVLKYHFEEWDPAGYSIIWVNVSQIDGISNQDYIWLYYNNSGASDTQDVEGTYDSSFSGVWHLNETSGIHYDATSNNNDGSPQNGVVQNAQGQIDGADDFDGNNDYVNCGDSGSLDITTAITIEAWVRPTGIDHSGNDLNVVHKYADSARSYVLSMDDDAGDADDWDFRLSSSGTGTDGLIHVSNAVDSDTWQYVAATWDGSTMRLYKNSVEIGIPVSFSGPIWFGDGTYYDAFEGIIDEVRISNKSRSADWISAQYLSMTDNFITFSVEETRGQERGATYIFFGYSGIGSDDINAANADVMINGTNTGDLFGWSVSDAGNINGDSYDDIIIGAPGYGANSGRAYIFYGRATGSWSTIDDPDTDSDVNHTGKHDNDRFGWSVSVAGDINSDNYSDVIIGAYSLGSDQGRAYILYGPDLNMSGHAYSYAESLTEVALVSTASYTDYLTLTINPPVATKYLIIATSDTAPDDKVGDNTWLRLIVDDTDVYHETNREFEDALDWYHFSAMKYIYLSAGSHDIELEYKTEGDNGRFRNSRIMAIEMDIPADQYDENEGTTESSTTEVVAAETTFIPTSSGDYLIIATANLYYDSVLNSVYGRLYIDGTMYGETLMEPDDLTNERFNFGVFKNITLNTNSHTISLTVDSENPSVSGYMDHAHIAAIRLDEFSEFHYNEAEAQNSGPGGWETLVTNSYTPEENGEFIILGTAEWFSNHDSAINGIRLQTASTTRQESCAENQDATDRHMTFGMDQRTLSGARSDTVDHLMNNGGWSKFARLISLPLGLDYVRLTGVIANEEFGFSVSNAGDTNNTGYDDVIVGAPGGDRAYIFCGDNAMDYSISAANANTILVGIGGSNFGFSVGNASDINADGSYDDVIVGMPDFGNGNAGIYYGGNPMNVVPDVTLAGETAGDKFGYSVHYAGDIDGDGDPDVIVGAPYLTNGTKTECGAFYVFCGGSDIDATEEYKNEGEYSYDHFGWSVSFAGDLNGDGTNETLSGAPHYNTQAGETPSSSADAGKAYGHSRLVIPEFSDAFIPITGIIALFVISRVKSHKKREEAGEVSDISIEMED
jgi:hypothetical protein